MVCQKVVCERWYVTNMGVKNGVRNMVCDKVVCERWYVTKMVCDRWCVKDGVSESLAKMVCDRREAGGRRPGIQNQKQEPHTKLWGTKKSLRAVRIARLGRPSWCMTPKICFTLVRARISLGLIWVNDSPHLGTCAFQSNRPSGLNDAPYSHSPWTWICTNSLRHPHCLQKWMPPPGALL